MNYFFANLSAHALLCLILVILMIIFTNRYIKRKTKHTLTYFVPVLLLIIIGFDVIKYLAPRMFDIDNVLNDVTYTYTGTVDEVSRFNNYIVVDGTTYYLDPFENEIEAGSTVKIKYTPASNYAMSVTQNIDNPEG